MWKIDFMNILFRKKGIVIIIIGILLEFTTFSNIRSLGVSNEQYYNRQLYDYYMKMYEGEAENEKLKDITEKIETWQSEIDNINIQMKKYNMGEITYEEYAKTVIIPGTRQTDVEVLSVIKDQIEYALNNGEDNMIFNQEGWIYFLDRSSVNYIIPVLLVLLLMPLFTESYESGMNIVESCCRKGKASLLFHKIKFSLLMSAVVCILFFVIEICCFSVKYNFPYPMENIKSIEYFNNLVLDMPLFIHALFVLIQWIAGCIFVTGIIALVGLVMKNRFNASVLTITLILVPVIIMEKIKWFEYVLPISFFSDGGYINGVNVMQYQKRVISGEELAGVLIIFAMVLLFIYGTAFLYYGKRKNIRLIGILCMCIMISGCKKDINEDYFYVDIQRTKTEYKTDNAVIYMDDEMLEYVIDFDNYVIPLHNDPLNRISESHTLPWKIIVMGNIVYYDYTSLINGETITSFYRLDTETMERTELYSIKSTRNYLKVGESMQDMLESNSKTGASMFIATDDFIVYGDTNTAFLYNINTGEDKVILYEASNFGVYKGKLYYTDRNMKLHTYDINTEDSVQISEAYVRAYIPTDKGIVYIDAMDGKLKLYNMGKVRILDDGIVSYLDYDKEGIYYINEGQETIRVTP